MADNPTAGKDDQDQDEDPQGKRTRIQQRNREAILDAALQVFSADGFRGATLDRIAAAAGLSKPNVLYYFASKEAIYLQLLHRLMDDWLAPLKALDPDGEPIDEIVAYVRRKLEMSRDYPRESRLFAQEVLQGAPNFRRQIRSELRPLVNAEAAIIRGWSEDGRIAALDAHHLIFSIWATTQHYADFDVQVEGVLDQDEATRFAGAEAFLVDFYRRALEPR